MLTSLEKKLGSLQIYKDMAQAGGAQDPPTFKLVLVGDGGTGKVGVLRTTLCPYGGQRSSSIQSPLRHLFVRACRLTIYFIRPLSSSAI